MKSDIKTHQPRKRFGQHFLKDERVIDSMIAALKLKPSDRVVEIGPGLGALTKPLFSKLNRLEVIELDRDLADKLNKEARIEDISDRFIVHQADALRFDYSKLLVNKTEKLRLIGNLPYNISTPLLFHLLSYCSMIQDMHFMLQLELVERISSQPNHKSYGKLSIMLQYYCQATTLFTVEPQAFSPPPKVRSAILRLVPYTTPPYPAKNVELLREITGAAFNLRRKTLTNSLKNYLTSKELNHLDIDPVARPEQLSVADFVRIANFISEQNEVKK